MRTGGFLMPGLTLALRPSQGVMRTGPSAWQEVGYTELRPLPGVMRTRGWCASPGRSAAVATPPRGDEDSNATNPWLWTETELRPLPGVMRTAPRCGPCAATTCCDPSSGAMRTGFYDERNALHHMLQPLPGAMTLEAYKPLQTELI
jgi:hypothetical protein